MEKRRYRRLKMSEGDEGVLGIVKICSFYKFIVDKLSKFVPLILVFG